jgi:hypothetical protein
MVLLLLVGGFVQGLSLDDPTLSFAETTQTILPYLRGRTLSWILLTGLASGLCIPFRIDAARLWPHRQRPDVPQPTRTDPGRRALMKGLQPIFLGIFGIFAFSWLGMTVVPNLQIGSLNPQSDEEGTDIYPMPPSGMALRGAQVYAANGCAYCHTQQVRPNTVGQISSANGAIAGARRAIIFSSRSSCSGKCGPAGSGERRSSARTAGKGSRRRRPESSRRGRRASANRRGISRCWCA